MDKKVVFFGPFIGEFGWELLYWHGWVRQFCIDNPNVYCIACSMPGRKPFYPLVDEFWEIPDWFVDLQHSSKSYLCDYWSTSDTAVKKLSSTNKYFIFEKEDVCADQRINKIFYESEFKKLKEMYLEKLPVDATVYDPTTLNKYNQVEFGTQRIEHNGEYDYRFKAIPFEKQSFDYLKPSEKAESYLQRLGVINDNIIAILPRKRDVRRPDKNWKKEYYLEIIKKIKSKYTEYIIVIIGDSNGAYFADEKIEGVIDLINIPLNLRMDVQVAALKRSKLALGSMSGAILVALACGAPSLTWGHDNSRYLYYYENKMLMNSPLIYYPNIDVEPAIILKVIDKMLTNNYSQSGPWEDFHIENEFKDRYISRFRRMIGNFVFNRKKHWIE
jgi:hypothetical protein